MPRDVVQFEPNVPLRVGLAYSEGKICDSRFGQRVMFTLVDGRVMFLDLDVAQKINELGPKPRQPFYIRKEHTGKKGELPHWRVWLSGDESLGEQPDGTFVVPNGAGVDKTPAPVRAATRSAETQPSNNTNGHGTTGKPPAPPDPGILLPWAQHLLSKTNALIAVYAAALSYSSEKYGNAVKPDDVRALLTTVWIAETRNGGPDAA